MNASAWVIFPGNPGLSAVVLLAASMLVLYAARTPMHQFLRESGHALSRPLRVAARLLRAAAEEMNHRNKAVLLAHARREVEARLDWEFERVGVLVAQELTGYAEAQRKLMEEIARLEDDYKKCGETPPAPPDWVDALAAVAGVKSAGGEMVQGILEQIRASMGRIHDKAIAEYRRGYKMRHRVLGTFLPFWRSVEKTMTRLDRKLAELQSSAATVDAQMDKYRELCAQSDRATRALTVSAFTELVIAALVTVVAVGGAFVNFKLISFAMSGMVSHEDAGAGVRVSEAAALAVVLVQACMGLFVMEMLRVTHLFPALGRLGEPMRQRMLLVALALLVGLSLVEASLAAMGEMPAAEKLAVVQSLGSPQPLPLADLWVANIPVAAQKGLAFLLPLALAFVAIPLESFVHSLRSVLGTLLVAAARVVALALRLAAQVALHASRVLLSVYDLLIALPLLAERIGKGTWAHVPVTHKRSS